MRMIKSAEYDLRAPCLLGPSVKYHLCDEGTIYEPLAGKINCTRLKLIIIEVMNSYSLEFFINQKFSPAQANHGVVLPLSGKEALWKMSVYVGAGRPLGHYLHTTFS